MRGLIWRSPKNLNLHLNLIQHNAFLCFPNNIRYIRHHQIFARIPRPKKTRTTSMHFRRFLTSITARCGLPLLRLCLYTYPTARPQSPSAPLWAAALSGEAVAPANCRQGGRGGPSLEAPFSQQPRHRATGQQQGSKRKA